MAILVEGQEGNTLDVPPEFLANGGGKICFTGQGARLVIGENCNAQDILFVLSGNSEVTIGEGSWLAAMELYTCALSSISIGRRCGFTWKTHLLCHEAYNIEIGDDCLFASGTTMTVSDMHSIIDVATGQRLNFGANTSLGSRVWLGSNVTILKGVSIGSGSLVAIGSVVTKAFPSQCAIGGVPAKIIRKGVTWSKDLLPLRNDHVASMVGDLRSILVDA